MSGIRLSLRSELTCPSCWSKLKPEELLWISKSEETDPAIDLGDDKRKRFLPSRFDVRGFAIDADNEICEEIACPKCHLAFPRILLETQPLFVSIIGGPQSGKSYFLASSIWESRKKLREMEVSFMDKDPVANQIISTYEQKLFLNDNPDQMVAIPKTEQEGELYRQVDYGNKVAIYPRPFVFSLKPTTNHLFVRQKYEEKVLSRALCLYDNAGEHFQPTAVSSMSLATDHLALSASLIFVFDPIQHAGFRARCREFSHDPQLDKSFDISRQDEILAEAAKRIRQKINLSEHERFKTSLIVVVNKYDVWRQLLPELDLDRINPYIIRPQATSGINVNVISEVSNRIKKFLLDHAADFVVACEAFCENITYIPVSAQGCSPEKSDGPDNALGVRPSAIKPIWAEVPMLYAINRGRCNLVPGLKVVSSANGSSGQTTPPRPRSSPEK